jgi:double-stranded RNA-binding protein Staufen
MMNNQQQHAALMNSNPVAPVSSVASQQRNMMPQQRGGSQSLSQSNSPYQMQSTPISQFSHLQQQHVVNNYHKQKQMSPNMNSHDFSSSAGGGMPTQNGNFQSMAGSSLHSGRGLDNGQLGMQQHQHHQYQSQQPQSLSTSVQQHHYQAQQQQQQQQQGGQQPYQSFQQQHHMMQQQQQQQQNQQQQIHSQHQQVPQQQTMHQQHQHMQLQRDFQQRNLNQQQPQPQRYQKQQAPKQILQHNPPQGKPLSTAPQDPPVKPITILSNHQHTNSGSKSGTVTNGQISNEETTTEKQKAPNAPEKEMGQIIDNEDSVNNASETQNLANTKEKTPMCLINELARFNKMNHQYTLVDEQGPAHKKTFYVKLKLGDEEYSASGESIKKAQHAAAAIALADTKYQHPPPKPARLGSCNLEKTVELNALAMKRGEAAVYKSIEPQQPPYYHQPNMDFRGMYNQRYHQYMRAGRDPRYRGSGVLWPLRYHYPRMNRAFYVSLRVGHREFIGDGPTRQAARHNAAQKALRILKNLPLHNSDKKSEEQEEEEVEDGTCPDDEDDDSLKSEISLVHEIALRRNMVVQFEVIRETGPPHMKNFVTRCTVSDMVTEGEGNSKKSSKKKAAELMLEELRKLPPLAAPAFPRPKSKIQINKKKNRNLIKSELQQQKADPNYGVGINPISRLIQIMQAQKKKEPVYTLVTERGLPRRREFIVQVEVEEKTCTGSGPNKKLAKRAAAEAMLQVLGYTKPSPQPTKSSFKNPAAGEGGQANGDKKVTFVEGDSTGDGDTKISTTPNQQRVPGLLHLPTKSTTTSSGPVGNQHTSSKESLINLASILKPNLRPEVQLRELCKAMDCQLEIDDFTKKRQSGTEHITRITIGSDNPQSFHGSNTTLESSRDMAALDALKVLVAKAKDVHPGGDGPQVKKEVLTRSGSGLKKDFSK